MLTDWLDHEHTQKNTSQNVRFICCYGKKKEAQDNIHKCDSEQSTKCIKQKLNWPKTAS